MGYVIVACLPAGHDGNEVEISEILLVYTCRQSISIGQSLELAPNVGSVIMGISFCTSNE